MNKLVEILLIIISATMTILATYLAGYFYGGIKLFELVLVGMSIIRIIILIFKRNKKK